MSDTTCAHCGATIHPRPDLNDDLAADLGVWFEVWEEDDGTYGCGVDDAGKATLPYLRPHAPAMARVEALEVVGSLGARFEDVRWGDHEPEDGERRGHSDVDGPFVYRPGEWFLRMDDEGGLIDPIPVYATRAALAAYTNTEEPCTS